MSLITQLREKAGMSMTACAQRAGMDLGKLSRLESGKMHLRFADVVILARALGCDTKDLIPSLDDLGKSELEELPSHV